MLVEIDRSDGQSSCLPPDQLCFAHFRLRDIRSENPLETPRKTCSNQDHQDFPLKNNPKKNPTHREIHFKTQRSISQSLGFGTSAQQGTDRLAGLWGFTVAYCRHCTFLGAVDPISLDPFRKVGVKTPGNMG